jgi:hypothetical protein
LRRNNLKRAQHPKGVVGVQLAGSGRVGQGKLLVQPARWLAGRLRLKLLP